MMAKLKEMIGKTFGRLTVNETEFSWEVK